MRTSADRSVAAEGPRRRLNRASAGPRRCARRPSAALAFNTRAVYPVQAGVSLHQAPHLIEQGISPIIAATVISSSP